MSKLLAMMMREKTGVMDLTAVGSPTISNGVVSGFTANDYLQTGANSFTNEMFAQYLTNSEIVLRIKSNATSDQQILSIPAGGTYGGFFARSNSRVVWQISGTTYRVSSGTGVIQADTFYWIKATIKNNIATLSYSIDGITYIQLSTLDISEMPAPTLSYSWLRFGLNYNNENPLTEGSIVIPQCYMILSGTKYIFTLP